MRKAFEELRKKQLIKVKYDATKLYLVRKNINGLFIELVCPPIDNLKVSGILLIAYQLSDKCPYGCFDKIGAFFFVLLGTFINNAE